MSAGGPYPNGCLFRYTQSENEPVIPFDPAITFEMAGRPGRTVAEDEAVKTGNNHVGIRLINPRGWGGPAGHRELSSIDMTPFHAAPLNLVRIFMISSPVQGR
jgi:hypothetical protein